MAITTVKYRVVLLGGSRVGKKSFIHAAELMFFKESLFSSNNTDTDRKSRRLSLNRLSQTFKTANTNSINFTIPASSPPKSPPRSPRSPEQETDESQVLNTLLAMTPELTGVAPNTIVFTLNNIRYEVHIVSFYDTGFTEEEQEEVTKADGYFIMVDLTNKFSIQRARMFHKKLLQMKDPNFVQSNQCSFFDKNKQSAVTDDSNDISTPTTPSSEQNNGQLKLPLILLGSKADEQKKRQITTIEGIRLADSWSCPFIECSTLSAHNKGIDSAIRQLVNIMDEKKKRQSLAFLSNTSEVQAHKPRFSWRRSLNISLGGGSSSRENNNNIMEQIRAIDDLDGQSEQYQKHRQSTSMLPSFAKLRAKLMGKSPKASSSQHPHRTNSSKDLRTHTLSDSEERARTLSEPVNPKRSTSPPSTSTEKRKWFNRK